MNIRIAFAVLSLAAILVACGDQANKGPVGPNGYVISGSLANAQSDSLYVYALDGFNYKKIGSTPLVKKGSGDSATFSMRGEVPRPGFYWVGTSLQKVKGLPLGGDKVTVKGDASRFNQATIKSSTLAAYVTASQALQKSQSQIRALENQVKNAPEMARDGMSSRMTKLYEDQKKMIDTLITENTIVGKTMQLEMLAPYIPGISAAPNEITHYAENFLKEADLSDPDFAYIPLSDKVQEYTLRLAQMKMDGGKITEYLNKLLARVPKGSITEKNVLARVVYALEMTQNAAYPAMVEKYLAVAPNDARAATLRQNAQAIAMKARQEAEANAKFAPGVTPPEIALKNTKGKTVKLSSLKGKVVMIDFWASWCGPCRRENPNVVKLYNKYKNKGFEILGVSLDKDKNKWEQAIKQDKLDWIHVSDLKFWQCEAAQDYGVRGIPATFLLDKEGKMIAKGLRGPALEQKLAEIFGA